MIWHMIKPKERITFKIFTLKILSFPLFFLHLMILVFWKWLRKRAPEYLFSFCVCVCVFVVVCVVFLQIFLEPSYCCCHKAKNGKQNDNKIKKVPLHVCVCACEWGKVKKHMKFAARENIWLAHCLLIS